MQAWQRNAVLPGAACVLIAAAIWAAPPKQQSYESWNTKWFATCNEESFIVNVSVENPKSGGPHTFKAAFLPGGGKCEIGSDVPQSPQSRSLFLDGTMNNGNITGTIYLCTTSQELVNKNQLVAVFTRKFQASYSAEYGNITDAIYKNEHYKRYDADTKDSGRGQSSGKSDAYQRDEPGDPEYGFDMHRYRGPAYDQVTQPPATGQPTPMPPSPAGQAKQKLDDVVHEGISVWYHKLREMMGAPPIHST